MPFFPHAEQMLLKLHATHIRLNRPAVADETQITLWMLWGAGVAGGVYLDYTIRGSFKQWKIAWCSQLYVRTYVRTLLYLLTFLIYLLNYLLNYLLHNYLLNHL